MICFTHWFTYMDVICKSSLKAPLASLSALILIRFKVLLSPLSLSLSFSPFEREGTPSLLGWQVLSDNPPNSQVSFYWRSSISYFLQGAQEGNKITWFPNLMSSSSLISVRFTNVVHEICRHLEPMVKRWQVTGLLFLRRRTECHKVSPR